MYSVVSRVVYRQQDREDACQATFLSLVKSASRIRYQKSIASWLYSTAFRIAFRIRQKTRSNVASLSVEDLQMIEQQSPDPLTCISNDIEFEKLNSELNQLPQSLRDPLVEHYFLGHSAAVIAERMELSVSAVEGRLRRGKQRLRTQLARKGIGLSLVLGAATNWQNSPLSVCDRVFEICIQAIHHSGADAGIGVGINSSASQSLSSASSRLVNSHVLSLVQGEMAMSTIGLSKVMSGFGIGACALLLTAAIAGLVMRDSVHVNHVSALAMSSTFATETNADGFTLKTVTAEANVGNRNTSEGKHAWNLRGEAAIGRLEKALAALDSEIDIHSVETTIALMDKIANITGLPITMSPTLSDIEINSLADLKPIDVNRIVLGKKTAIPARDLLERLVAANPGLTYVIESNKIELVAIDDKRKTIRFYNVSQILKTQSEDERRNLVQIVEDYVLGDEANFAGGSAVTSVVGSMLVVSCAEASHQKIEEFLEQILLVEDGLEGVTSRPGPVNAGMGGMM